MDVRSDRVLSHAFVSNQQPAGVTWRGSRQEIYYSPFSLCLDSLSHFHSVSFPLPSTTCDYKLRTDTSSSQACESLQSPGNSCIAWYGR